MTQERQVILTQQAQSICDMMAASTAESEESLVEEVVIEYQRKVPFHGFKHDHLFLHEAKFRCRSTSHDFKITARTLTATPDFDSLGSYGSDSGPQMDSLLCFPPPPAGWAWAGEWEPAIEAAVEAGAKEAGTDSEGWRYAFNFGAAWEPSGGTLHFVRRRVWRRRRARQPGPRSVLGSMASALHGSRRGGGGD
jgi:hypothetical protein